MRARAATPSQVCSAPAWHTHIMGTLWGSPPSVGRRGPPTLQFMVKGGLAWTPRAVCDSGLSPIAQKGGLGSISPSSQSACSEACSPAAHRHGAAFLRGPARCQLPMGTVLRSSEGRLHASCPQARGCVPPRAGSMPAAHGHGVAFLRGPAPRQLPTGTVLRSSEGRLDASCPRAWGCVPQRAGSTPAAHRHGAAFLRGPARRQLPTGTWGCVPPRAGWTSSAYCAQVSVSLGDKRPLFPPCSPDTCTSPMPAHPAPSSLTPHQWGAGTQLGRGGRGPGRSQLRPPPPASILGGPKTALWRTGRGCLPPGRFISSFFKPCSDFSMSPRPLPRQASLPSPSNLSAQPGERATGLQVIELLRRVGVGGWRR